MGLSRSSKHKDIVKEILLNIDKDKSEAFNDVLFEVLYILEAINDVDFSKKFIKKFQRKIGLFIKNIVYQV